MSLTTVIIVFFSFKGKKRSYLSIKCCVKSVRIRSYSGPHFPAFGLYTNHNNSEYGHFLRSDICDQNILYFQYISAVFSS